MAMAMSMSMSMTQSFPPNPIPFPTTKHPNYPLTHHQHHHHKATIFSVSSKENNRQQLLNIPRVASTSTSVPHNPINVDYLEDEFGGRGVTFQPLGDSCVATLALDNGSVATLMLPSGLLTSYKAAMWHGGTDEMLHSTVVPGDVEAKVQGGVSLPLEFWGEDGVSWCPSNWALRRIKGNSKRSIEVELISTDSAENVEIKYTVTLLNDELKSEILISNSRSSSIQLSGCILSHLRVSSPEATYAIGLLASDFHKRPPLESSFGIIPPDYGLNKGSRVEQLLNNLAFWQPRKQSDRNERKSEQAQPKEDQEMEGEETENYKNLKEEMCLIYTSAPRNVTVMDRGRRNSVMVGRNGFSELYMFCPGSGYEIYGEYSFICVGQSAMLKLITVGPEQELRLGQDLFNPNL